MTDARPLHDLESAYDESRATVEQQRDGWRQQYIYASEENADLIGRLCAESLSPEADERLTIGILAQALHMVNVCVVKLDGPFGCRICRDYAERAVKANPILRVALLPPAAYIARLAKERDDAVAASPSGKSRTE